LSELRRYSMGKNIKIRKKGLFSFLIYPAIGLWLLSGCASSSSTDAIMADNTVVPSLEETSYAQQDRTAASREIQLAAEIPEKAQREPEEAEVTLSDPRIFIQPRQSDLTQILGIDFMTLEQGKSRLTLTTDKRVKYDLEREGDKALLLKLHNTTVPDVLLREIDTTHFETALDKVKPSYSTKDKESEILISLREMVPFHIKHTQNSLTMDFGQTSVSPPDKKIVPLNLAETQTRTLAATQVSGTMPDAGKAAQAQQKRYTGKPMYLDFDNADVTHVLRLINEMSEENIIWDTEIKGRTVSMILEEVPWDQALDLILDNNDLAKRYRGDNIIWITTKDKMNKILAEEAAEAERQRQELETERKRQEEERKKAEESAPLVTEFLPVDFAKADDIKGHITLTDRGTMSIDTRTNTIIIKDIPKSIEDAKKTIEQFDTPVKQIMIEARIVDATDQFSRDLGIKWNADHQATANSMSISSGEANVEVTGTGAAHISDDGALGGSVLGGSFSTNSPEGWASNIGIGFMRLASNGLGVASLDASLAIAESEGTAKTLSAPKVIAQEGVDATIKSGETIYTNPTENVAQTSRDAALTLNVKPISISYNGYITLSVSVTDNKNVSATLDTTKEIHTELMVKSGETIVIGGIIKESEADNITGIPVLRDIPGLGWLFKAKTKTKDKSELLIFLTPTVLPSPVNELF
jgi:type IV pilus assembly protein PilQ